MTQKWIIYKNELKMGNVTLHEDFLGSKSIDKEERKEVRGGGLFEFCKDEEEFKLFGSSFDFGSCSVEDFEEIKWPTRFETHSFYFTDPETGIVTKVK